MTTLVTETSIVECWLCVSSGGSPARVGSVVAPILQMRRPRQRGLSSPAR